MSEVQNGGGSDGIEGHCVRDNETIVNANTESNRGNFNWLSRSAHLTFNQVSSAGPPCKHVNFPQAEINLAMVDKVVYYDLESEKFIHQEAFFRVSEEGDRSLTECAYTLSSENVRRKTQMGSIQLCHVLERDLSSSPVADDLDSLEDEMEDHSCNSHSREDFSTSSDDSSFMGNRTGEIIFQATYKYVAVKISSKRAVMQKWASGESRAENPWHEIAAAQLIGREYPNLLGIIEALEDSDNLYTVMRYCPGGDLYDYIEKHKNRTEEHARYCFYQILKGLDQLQICGIFHRDLSIENIMLHDDRCVIIDFGMCLKIPVGEDGIRRLIVPQGACGKVRYMTPETFANRVSNRHPVDGPTGDLWAAGVILFVLLTGKFPYLQPDSNDVGFCWATNDIASLLQSWDIHVSPSAVDLLQKMFQLYPNLRCTLAQVMEHPWVTGIT